MLEIIQNLENAVAGISPPLLVIPGLIVCVLGLSIWLGGLGFRKAIAAVAAALIAASIAFFAANHNLTVTFIAAVVAGLLTIVLEKMFILITTAVVLTALAFVFLAKPFLENAETITQAFALLPSWHWIALPALFVAVIIIGLLFWPATAAVSCAAIGSILIFAAMTILLLYKGSLPLTCIYNRLPYFAAVFAAMTAFGAIEQMLLCKTKKQKPVPVAQANSDSKP